VEATYWDTLNLIADVVASWPPWRREEIHSSPMFTLLCGQHSEVEFLNIQQKISQLSPSRMLASGAFLLEVKLIQHVIFGTSIQTDYVTVQDVLEYAISLGHDVAKEALECFYEAWNNKRSEDDILNISRTYIALLSPSISEDLVCLILTGIVTILDERPTGCDCIVEKLHPDLTTLQIDTLCNTPKTESAAIELSGYIILTHVLVAIQEDREMERDKILSWGRLIRSAMQPDNVSSFRISLEKCKLMI
jgi:hypothetical protein